MEKLIIHPIPLMYGDFKYAKARMTYLHYLDEDIRLYCFIWYIEGAKEKILVDAGSTAEIVAKLFPNEGNVPIQGLEEGLKKYNVKPADIDRVIVTHLHWDHIWLAHEYVNARFVIQEDELNAARDSDSQDPGYVPALFEGLDFEIVKGDVQITDGVRVLSTPGHTAGGQSIAVETEKGVAVIPGFCCIRENFEPRDEIRKKTPFIIPGAHINVSQCRESMQKVIDAADIIVPLHGLEYIDIDTVP